MSDYIERKSIRNMYSCLNPNDRVLVGQVLIDIDAIPSAEVPTTMTGVIDAIREAEYRGYMKAVEERPKGEWKHLKGDEWFCSECGYVIWTEGSWEHPLERGKDYCEHCGANMTMKGADDE